MKASEINLNGKHHYRIIPSVFPPINFFEELVDPNDMETLWEIENLTNERIREEVGDLSLVAGPDRVSGPGSSVVMAAFTHIGYPSRFTDGSFGIYYASFDEQTAIKETVYQRETFLAATAEEAGEITMRMYEAKIQKPLLDIRDARFKLYHHSENYSASQKFGFQLKTTGVWGLVYNSVRHAEGECIALFRPPATTIPVQTKHLRYVWNGEKIIAVLDVKPIDL